MMITTHGQDLKLHLMIPWKQQFKKRKYDAEDD